MEKPFKRICSLNVRLYQPAKRYRSMDELRREKCELNPDGGPHEMQDVGGEDRCIYCKRIFGQHVSEEDRTTHSAEQDSLKRAETGKGEQPLEVFVSEDAKNVSQQHLAFGETARNNTALGVRDKDLRSEREKKIGRLVKEARMKWIERLGIPGQQKDNIEFFWNKFLNSAEHVPSEEEAGKCFGAVMYYAQKSLSIVVTPSTIAKQLGLDESDVSLMTGTVRRALEKSKVRLNPNSGSVQDNAIINEYIKKLEQNHEDSEYLIGVSLDVYSVIKGPLQGCKPNTVSALAVYLACLYNSNVKFRPLAERVLNFRTPQEPDFPTKGTILGNKSRCALPAHIETVKSGCSVIRGIDGDLFKADFN